MKNDLRKRVRLALPVMGIVVSVFLSCAIVPGPRYNHRGHYRYHGPYLAAGSFVRHLPYGYTVVVIGNVPYYCFEGTYFRPYSSGFLVVDAPVVVNAAPMPAPAQPQITNGNTNTGDNSPSSSNAPQTVTGQSASDTLSVNVPNSKGGFTPVKLIKQGNGYVGPQGEFYPGHPTVDELKTLYGN